MRVRVAGILKHPKSGIYWFRMAVPVRHRIAVGKREIKESLQTRTEALARQKHAAKLAEVASLFARLDSELDQDVGQQALAICRSGFDQMSRRNLLHHDDGVTTLAEAEDNVLLGMLMVLTYRVRCTWGDDHAIRAELELLGEDGGDAFPDLLPAAIVDRDEQDRSAEAIRCLEGNFIPVLAEDGQEFHVHRGRRSLSGIVCREIAAALLRREDWKFVELEVVLVAEAAGVAVQMGTRLYDSVAENTLMRLANFRRNDASTVVAASTLGIGMIGHSVPKEPPAPRSSRTLLDGFRQWCKNKAINLDAADKPDPPHKTAHEWNLARQRFEQLFGSLPLSDISSEMVHDFRDVLAKLPSRPKRAVGQLPLRKQAEVAKAKGLKLLDPNSVKKQITAIQTMLGAAVGIDWISLNVANSVAVEGAGYVGDERDFFTLEELRTIFASPLMTDPDACSDSMFFIILLEALHGGRPGELAKMKPNEILFIDDTPTMRIRRSEGRKQKTNQSIRDIPLHEIAVAGGLLKLGEIRRNEGSEWLFPDLKADKFGDRYKLLSRKINRQIRLCGVTAVDKCFYSARHAHKREVRRQRISEANSDQMSGHGNGKNVGRKYGQGAPIETLKEDIDRVIFRGVDWEPVILCSLTRIARLSHGTSKAA